MTKLGPFAHQGQNASRPGFCSHVFAVDGTMEINPCSHFPCTSSPTSQEAAVVVGTLASMPEHVLERQKHRRLSVYRHRATPPLAKLKKLRGMR